MATKKELKPNAGNITKPILEEGKSKEKQIAEIGLCATTLNAVTARIFTKNTTGLTDISETIITAHEKVKAVNNGDLKDLEATLTSQVTSLNAIYGEMARRASINMSENLNATESYMRLALKAQAQCARTVEVIADMKNPAVIFAKQANIAQGNQQVNNGSLPNSSPARAGKIVNHSNELLEANNGKTTMDIRTTQTAIGKDKAMAAVETLNRRAND